MASFIAQFVSFGIFSYILSSFMKPMIEDLEWTRAQFTISRVVGQFVMAATGFFIGSLVDRYGGRPLMLVGATIVSLSLALHSQVTSLSVTGMRNFDFCQIHNTELRQERL